MLELFHKMNCPYSARVRDYIENRGLESEILYHDTETENGAKDRLQKIAFKTQVPCLVVNGKPVLESDEIIDWLEKNLH